ncbi:hypothetical protein B0H10DRAFT_2222589 [Mycena sp. CBHHK59/15]|nr:hypothetical protein B0H10DRAFT_2222589 [Mycena sp. CBHHK59/15]
MPVKARLKVHLQQLSQHSIVGQVASCPIILAVFLVSFTIYALLLGLSLSTTCNCIAVDPQDGYRIVVFDNLFWTLAVRFAWCDARFDGVSAMEAREHLEELSFDGNPAILQSSEWSDPVTEEAIRTFFWARAVQQASHPTWEDCEPPPLSPLHSSILNSSDGVDSVSDRAEPPTERHHSSLPIDFFRLVIQRWRLSIYYMWAHISGPWRCSVD